MTQKKPLATIIGAAAAAAVFAFTGGYEGLSNTPYRDSGGVWTVCRGQTGVTMRYYMTNECDAMFADTLADVAAQLQRNTPGFDSLPGHVKAASVDFAYNVGVGNYAGSTYRAMLVRRELPAACDQIERWKYVGAQDCSVPGNKVCAGVWTRRQAERKMCKGEYGVLND